MVRVVIPLPRLRHDNTPIVFVGDFGDPVPVGVVGVDGAGDIVIDARLAGGDELGDVDTDAGVDLNIDIAIANAIDDRILGDDAVGDVGADGRSISSTRLRRRSISASFDASLILSFPISVSFSANIACTTLSGMDASENAAVISSDEAGDPRGERDAEASSGRPSPRDARS